MHFLKNAHKMHFLNNAHFILLHYHNLNKMNSKKSPSKPSAGIPSSVSPTKLKLENELDRSHESPSKKAKKADVQVGVIGSSSYGDCAIEIRNGYSV